jgi:hypothetical protein
MAEPVKLIRCGDAAEWSDLHDRMRISILEQGWSYGEAVAAASRGRVRPERWVISDGSHGIGLVQAFVRQIGPFGRFVRLVRGPLFIPGLPQEARLAALAAIRGTYPWRSRCLLWWLPELNGGSESEATMARLGLRQVMTGYSSIRLDLTPTPERLRSNLDGKWRNALKTAEKSPMLVEVASRAEGSWNQEAFAALLAEHDEHRIERGFRGPDGRLYAAFAEAAGMTRSGDDAMLVWAHAGTHRGQVRPIAGILMLRHGRGATYAMGWSNAAGRLVNAHYRLLWRALAELKARGVLLLDLGGVDTEHGAGVARFKLGLNGDVFTLAGSFV